MSSKNLAILIGNIGKDAEVKTFANGGKIANFSLATSEGWKDRNGEWQNKTTWHNIKIENDRLIDNLAHKLLKGVRVCIEGKIDNRKYQDSSGQDRYVTEIVVGRFKGEVTLLDRSESSNSDSYQSRQSQPQQQQADPFDDMDSDVPF